MCDRACRILTGRNGLRRTGSSGKLVGSAIDWRNMSLDVVGPTEIADLFDVHVVTVDRWRRTGVLPKPDAVLARGPIWKTATICRWAAETGRTFTGTRP